MRKRKNMLLAALLGLLLIFTQQAAAFATGEETILSGETQISQTAAAPLADGTYSIPAETDQRMFYLVSDEDGKRTARLTVTGGQMTATFSLTGSGYDKLYMGKAEDAPNAEAALLSAYTVVDGKYTFTVPVSALDQPLDIAAHAVKSDNWYQHTISFYSSEKAKEELENKQEPGAKPDSDQNKDNHASGSGKTESDSEEKPADKEKDDNPQSGTQKITQKSGLADGVYTLDQFSWSGGSGRLAYIACGKITVKKGKAYATIRFSSSSYDKVRAGGSVYTNTGSSESTFTIPVKLNANNEISGRTVAMSAPHWISYTIYPYLAEAEKAAGGVSKKPKDKAETTGESADAKLEIIGLGEAKQIPMRYAKYCELYRYENGVKLLRIDMSEDSILSYEKNSDKKTTEAVYDEEGKRIAKSQSEITQELYRSSTVSYLLIPEGIAVPAGLEKEMILVSVPTGRIWSSSQAANRFLRELGCQSLLLTGEGNAENTDAAQAPDFKKIVQEENDFAILPSSMLAVDQADGEAAREAKQTQLETLQKRFATLGIPVLLDRSADEASLEAKAEWAKVYAALCGMEETEAEKACSAMLDAAFWDSLTAQISEAGASDAAEAEAETEQKTGGFPIWGMLVVVMLLLAGAAMVILKKKRKP